MKDVIEVKQDGLMPVIVERDANGDLFLCQAESAEWIEQDKVPSLVAAIQKLFPSPSPVTWEELESRALPWTKKESLKEWGDMGYLARCKYESYESYDISRYESLLLEYIRKHQSLYPLHPPMEWVKITEHFNPADDLPNHKIKEWRSDRVLLTGGSNWYEGYWAYTACRWENENGHPVQPTHYKIIQLPPSPQK